MTKATDKLLGQLHGKLAQSMLDSLQASDTAQLLLDAYGEDLPIEVVTFLEQLSTTNPSLMTAVAKFLKDNQITCSVEDSAELSELEQALQKKRKRVGNVTALYDNLDV